MTCEACSDISLCTLCGKDLLADLKVEDPRSTVASNLNSNFPHTVFGLIGRSLPISVHSVGILCVCGEGGGWFSLLYLGFQSSHHSQSLPPLQVSTLQPFYQEISHCLEECGSNQGGQNPAAGLMEPLTASLSGAEPGVWAPGTQSSGPRDEALDTKLRRSKQMSFEYPPTQLANIFGLTLSS